MEAYFPQPAYQAGVNGRATVACVVLKTGVLSACNPVFEAPVGYGFGEAAATLMVRHAQMTPHIINWQPIDNGVVRIPVTFTRFPGSVAAATTTGLATYRCERPAVPAVPLNGVTATIEQLLIAKSAVQAFMTASDVYQKCLGDEVQAKWDAAKAAHQKAVPALALVAAKQIHQNQRDKERIVKAFNSVLKAYKSANAS